MKKISMQYIADQLGVSKYTVSQALAGKEGVSEATRLKVTALAQALGYRVRSQSGGRSKVQSAGQTKAQSKPRSKEQSKKQPNEQPNEQSYEQPAERHGKRPLLSAPSSKVLVGMQETHMEEPLFWGHVKSGIEAGCRQAQLEPVFFTFHSGKPDLWLRPLLQRENTAEAAGFIIAGNCRADALLQLSHTGKPIVLADHEEPLIGADCVLNANVAAGRMAAHHLLVQGCHSLVFVGRDHYAVSFRERWWGCRMAVDDRNSKRAALKYGGRYSQLPEEANAVRAQLRKWTISYGGAPWQQTLRKKIEQEFAGLPDGFVCANDDIALELIEALFERGAGVPGQTRVVGIDNTAFAGQARLPLTSVDLGKEWLGLRAVESLLRRLGKPGAPFEKIILPATLVVRTTG